jgi:cytochrome b561
MEQIVLSCIAIHGFAEASHDVDEKREILNKMTGTASSNPILFAINQQYCA